MFWFGGVWEGRRRCAASQGRDKMDKNIKVKKSIVLKPDDTKHYLRKGLMFLILVFD
jgi:hypothetical protein